MILGYKYFGRYRLVLILLAIYFLIRAPSFFLPLPIYQIRFLGSISNTYFVSFIIFLVISNYDKIKCYLQQRFIGIILNRHESIRSDVLIFMAMALLITLYIDVFLTTISGQPLVSVLTEFIPGFGFLKAPAEHIISQQNPAKASSLKGVVNFLPGPPVGALVIFTLREIRYKYVKNNNMDNYPGGTVFLIFLFIVSFILIFDVYITFIANYNLVTLPNISFKQSKSSSSGNPLVIYLTNQSKSSSSGNPLVIYLTNQSKSSSSGNPLVIYLNQSTTPFVTYGQKEAIGFIILYVLSPFSYVLIIATWIFDRFLFSTYWLAR